MRKPIQTFIKTETFKAIEEMAKEQHTSNYKVAQKILEESVNDRTNQNKDRFSIREVRPITSQTTTKGITHNPGQGELDE